MPPLQPIPHPLTGLFEGIQRGILLGLNIRELQQRQAEREQELKQRQIEREQLLNLEKQKLQALTEYRQRENDLKMLNTGLGMLNDKNVPKGAKLNIYNSVVVPISKKLGLPLEVINDWPDGMDEYIKRATAIFNNKDYPWLQKKDLITSIMIEAGDDERFKPVIQSINERLMQEEQQAEQQAYNLHYKALHGEITPDEIDRLESLLRQYPAAYGRARKMAIENRRNELLMGKTQKEIEKIQKEIETPKQKYEIYYNPNTGETMHVDIFNREEVERVWRQGYRPWAAGAFKTKETEEEKYTLPQKLDDLRAEYNRMVDALDRKYGLKGGGLVSKTLLDLDEEQKARYLKDLNAINLAYNKEYKKLTKRNAPFLINPESVEKPGESKIEGGGSKIKERELSPIKIVPSLEEFFGLEEIFKKGK